MTPRERVRAALERREPDRVPIDLGSMGPTGISVRAYKNLCAYLGIRCECRVFDPVQQIAVPGEEILERFHVDLRAVVPAPRRWREEEIEHGLTCLVNDAWRPVTLPDGSKIVYEGDEILFRKPRGGLYYDHVHWPLEKASIEDLDSFTWPAPFSFYKLPDTGDLGVYLGGLGEEARRLRESTGCALVGSFGGSIYEAATGLVGYERFFRDLIENRAFIEKLFDRLLRANLEYAKRYLELAGEFLDVIMVGGEDIGTQRGLEISPALYREVVKPRQKELWSFIKRNSGAFIVVHCCGSMGEIVGDFAELGVDAVNPVQVSAEGMDSRKLKERHGGAMAFWGGGCDTQKALPFGAPEDVREEVKRRVKDLAPGGGFVFSQVHTIQADVRPENIVAMFDAAYEFGRYPIRIP
jgi:uroporphyrinogen decarboxylase